ncbi:MAG TPA: tRNA 2-thiouridine(34) synthase MnmA [Candidatus Paceibacterota bacterium]|nr:tRNA 2-thiouridine(34) synthase MnmA [Candidatus Paceibacterota bacterium]HMP18763.1 tRNA 2-thiouridine(34) synthase MnmA [Candidatus Paceibacterota bacterium]HMP85324.1 tRNA 2-thiouridine(34) synthase MnmA [Candidatus Paceibacterota bacterium]
MKKVFVGLSGGVDSSVSAYLLKKQGYNVVGVFIKVWYPEFVACNWRAEMRDAMKVCARLKIPFLLCDLEKEYKLGVFDYMIEEYKNGRTPNPDVMCNKEIKFKSFLNFAIQNNADFIATGHYAQNYKNSDEKFYLKKSIDQQKDQTYFLWNLNQDILKRVLFPIGHLNKKDVRKIAGKANLFTADKKDSQGLCFIGHVDMKNFLKNYIEINPGNVVDKKGNVIGKHEGAIFYTIGERHNFDIFHKKTTDKPFYVIDKDISKNILIVAEEKNDASKERILITNLNFINKPLSKLKNIEAVFRYRQKTQLFKIIGGDFENNIELENNANEEVPTSGQSAVFYDGDICLGGGIIN